MHVDLCTMSIRNFVVFDWDDTIFPTSQFDKFLVDEEKKGNTVGFDTPSLREFHFQNGDLFLKYRHILHNVLAAVFPITQRIYVVSNGTKSWLKKSEELFHELFSRYQVKFISAQDRSKKFDKKMDPSFWKKHTLTRLFKEKQPSTIISAGDNPLDKTSIDFAASKITPTPQVVHSHFRQVQTLEGLSNEWLQFLDKIDEMYWVQK